MVDQTKQPNLTPGTILQELDNFMNEHSGLWDKEEGGEKSNKSLAEVRDTMGSQSQGEWV